MPPPHLHPRSRMTSSLFATTVLASFFVVALPHALPCPAPRRAYADDGEMAGRGVRRGSRRGRREEVGEGGEEGEGGGGGGGGRECPVPKPGGVLGEWLGFGAASTTPRGLDIPLVGLEDRP
ncbi:hypothetical protein C8A05DRAFT_46776 [Staphylotrichum tortipilum]|uniref:Uncharacterized protein n=1 Tax=Staphylotrichum tortipilum TaxID=2831512 RepID=A0AAN6MDQ3_9PEZI|nr:hypothetical protein C8A05DRAFT_46776 [Staphylotrichum longicolle]